MRIEKNSQHQPAGKSAGRPTGLRATGPASLIPYDQYPGIIEFLPDATFVIDLEGKVLAWNRAMEQMTGVPKTQMLGKSGYAYAMPFYGEARPMMIDIAMRGINGADHEYRYLRKEGDTCFAETFCPCLNGGAGAHLWGKASPLYDRDGNIVGAVESLRDVMDRKLAEEALRRSEEKYRLIFENTPLGIFHFDSEGVVTACNDRIVEIWGSSKTSFIGFNLAASVKNKKMRGAVTACLSGKRTCFEGNYLSVTGGKISNLKADFGPILTAGGGVAGGIGVIEDISERKRAQEALAESEQQLRFLSAQLLTAQEQERKRISRGLQDSIHSSLAGIGISIENALFTAKKGTFDPHSLQSITAMVQHTIEELRRIASDLRPAILDEFGIIATVRWFARQFQSVYAAIEVETRIALEEEEIPEPLKIVIFRVVQEAFHNIARHSRASQVNVELHNTGDSVALRIQDNGTGFDPAGLREPGHKGLGLASMKERIELAGGSFEISSREGSGACIRARWPIGGY